MVQYSVVDAEEDLDAATTEDDAAWASEKNSLISHLLIRDAAHEIHHSHHDEFVKLVRDFIPRAEPEDTEQSDG